MKHYMIVASLLLLGCQQSTFKQGVQKKSSDDAQHKSNDGLDGQGTANGPQGLDGVGAPATDAIDVGASEEGDVLTLTFACNEDISLTKPITVTGSKAKTVRFAGQFCQDQNSTIAPSALVFAIDMSDSMATADRACNRQEGVRNFLLQTKIFAGDDADNIKVGFVTFGNLATSRALATIDESLAFIESADFCDTDGATNYEQAFAQASTLLSASEARNRSMYLLSDGLPTIWGNEARQAEFENEQRTLIFTGQFGAAQSLAEQEEKVAREKGIAASQTFLTTNAGAVINAIFLAQPGEEDVGKTYLTTVTGDASRIRVVGDSAGFLQELETFDNPFLRFKLEDLSGRIVNSNETIKFTSLSPAGQDGKIWSFETEAVARQDELSVAIVLDLGNGKTLAIERKVIFAEP